MTVAGKAGNRKLFIAVNLPAQAKNLVFSDASVFLASQRGLSVVPMENLHLTLLFIGFVDDSKIPEIAGAMERISAKSFSVKFGSLSSFGKRVIFLDVSKGRKELENLAGEVSSLVRVRGKKEKFRAHLTMARNKSLSRRDFESAMGGMNGREFGIEFLAASVELMESVPSDAGHRYSVIFSKKLL